MINWNKHLHDTFRHYTNTNNDYSVTHSDMIYMMFLIEFQDRDL